MLGCMNLHVIYRPDLGAQCLSWLGFGAASQTDITN